MDGHTRVRARDTSSVLSFRRRYDDISRLVKCTVRDWSEGVSDTAVTDNGQACYYIDEEWNHEDHGEHGRRLFYFRFLIREAEESSAQMVKRIVQTMASHQYASVFVGVRRHEEDRILECHIASCFCGSADYARLSRVLEWCGLPTDTIPLCKVMTPQEAGKLKQEVVPWLLRPKE